MIDSASLRWVAKQLNHQAGSAGGVRDFVSRIVS